MGRWFFALAFLAACGGGVPTAIESGTDDAGSNSRDGGSRDSATKDDAGSVGDAGTDEDSSVATCEFAATTTVSDNCFPLADAAACGSLCGEKLFNCSDPNSGPRAGSGALSAVTVPSDTHLSCAHTSECIRESAVDAYCQTTGDFADGGRIHGWACRAGETTPNDACEGTTLVSADGTYAECCPDP